MDSVGRIVSSMQAAAKDCQWSIPDEQSIREIIGLSLKVAIPILFGVRNEANSKPDPLMLEQILDQLSIPVTQALMVGDSIHDMEMARRLGMDRIGITWGSHDATALQGYAPCQIFDDLSQLLTWLPASTSPVVE